MSQSSEEILPMNGIDRCVIVDKLRKHKTPLGTDHARVVEHTDLCDRRDPLALDQDFTG